MNSMHRHSYSHDYQRYSTFPLSMPTLAPNTHYQLYRTRLESQPSFTYTSSHLLQQYQPTTRISDLAEPMSVFDDMKFPRRRQSHTVPCTPVYESTNVNRQVTVHATRFATACAFRERLLIDIQQNITEIDQELSFLERRPIMPRQVPSRLGSIHERPPPIYQQHRIEPRRPSRVYEVIPRIPKQPKIIAPPMKAPRPPPPPPPPPLSASLGHYHYGPEMEENEIRKGDPENVDFESAVNEFVDLSLHQPLSLESFRRVQSALPQHRVSIFIPEFIDVPKPEITEKTETTETIENSHQNPSVVNNPTPSILVEESTSFVSDVRMDATAAPESKPKIAKTSKRTHKKVAIEPVETTHTKLFHVLSSPTPAEPQLSRQQTEVQPTESKTNANNDDPEPFAGFERESINSDALISIYPESALYRTHSTLNTDILDTEDVSKLSNTLLSEPKSTEENAKDKTKEKKSSKKKKKKRTTKPTDISATTFPSSLSAASVFGMGDEVGSVKDPPQ